MKKLLMILIASIVFSSGCIGGPSGETSTTIKTAYETSSTVTPTTTTIAQTTTSPVVQTTTSPVGVDAPSTKAPTTTTTLTATTVYKPPVREFDMTANSFSFNPSTLRVKQGDRVKLTITSTDVTHSFAINEYGINVELPEGETKTVEFTADKKGTFTFRCAVFCGAGHGSMKGTLIVE